MLFITIYDLDFLCVNVMPEIIDFSTIVFEARLTIFMVGEQNLCVQHFGFAPTHEKTESVDVWGCWYDLKNLHKNENAERFFDIYIPVINRIVGEHRSFPHIDHDDIVQEIALTLWRKRSTVENAINLRSWIDTIARRIVAQHYQRSLEIEIDGDVEELKEICDPKAAKAELCAITDVPVQC